MFCVRLILEKELLQGREFRKLCTDLKNMYDSLSGVVLLGASAKLWEASIMFIMSVCMKEICSQFEDAHQILYFCISHKSLEAIQVSL